MLTLANAKIICVYLANVKGIMSEKSSNKYFISENNVPYSNLFQFGISIDCVVFGYYKEHVRVLLIERGAEPYLGYWALPGDLVELNEDLDKSANRILTHLTGMTDIFMEQFHTFGSVNRHPAGRVATVAYYSLVESENYQPIACSWAKSLKWFDIYELPQLAFDHSQILETAIDTLRRKVRTEAIGFELLPDKFTLLELQGLYEALLGYSFDKPNFRKKILNMELLVALNEVQSNVSHRPAKLFKFDRNKYKSLKEDGFSFEL